MVGRTPREALHAFIGPLQQSLSCITDEVLQYRSYGNKDYPNEAPHPITVNGGDRVRLRQERGIFLTFIMLYQILKGPDNRSPWEARTMAYYYALEDHSQQEIVAYHWHPDTPGSGCYPHMHLGPGAGISREELFHAHLPTGRIPVQGAIRLAIVDFKVHPLREDWNEILSANESRFTD